LYDRGGLQHISKDIHINLSALYILSHKPCLATILQWEGTSSFNFVSSLPYYNYLRLVLVSASVLLIQWMEYIICAMHIYKVLHPQNVIFLYLVPSYFQNVKCCLLVFSAIIERLIEGGKEICWSSNCKALFALGDMNCAQNHVFLLLLCLENKNDFEWLWPKKSLLLHACMD
jgi:hypothetical protein